MIKKIFIIFFIISLLICPFFSKSVNAKYDITSNLLVWLKFDIDLGTSIAYDSSGFNNNGYLYSDAFLDNTNGIYNNSLNLNHLIVYTHFGHVNITSTPLLDFTTQDFTISFWFYYEPLTGGEVLLCKGASNQRGYYMQMMGLGEDKLEFTSNQLGAQEQVFGSYHSIAENAWTFITVTKNSSLGVTIYSNAVVVGSGIITNPSSANNYPIDIGQYTDAIGTFATRGFYDEFRMYNRCLNSSEVEELYTYTPSSEITITQPSVFTDLFLGSGAWFGFLIIILILVIITTILWWTIVFTAPTSFLLSIIYLQNSTNIYPLIYQAIFIALFGIFLLIFTAFRKG